MIRVLVAEDSPTTRDLLVWILQSDPEIQVVGMARDGAEAVRLAARLRPDVITMDARMPEMDGAQATAQIMQQTPTPIVVASANAIPQEIKISFDALHVGALAVVEKPVGPAHPHNEALCARLVTTVKLMAGVKVVRRWSADTLKARRPIPPPEREHIRTAVVAIAASTGGPNALYQVLSTLPADFPAPILVVQHISHGFGQGLVEWLDRGSALSVRTARQREPLLPGQVLVAPDDRHLTVGPDGHVLLRSKPSGNGLCPAADPLFASVGKVYGQEALGVIMTGMGRDGVEGLKQLKAAGGKVLAQDEVSCVVFGMPKEAIHAGVVDRVVPLERLAVAIVEML